MIGWAAWWLASGCGHPVPPEPFLPFRFEARTTAGEVRVVPALRLHEPVAPVLGSALGSPVPYDQRHLRILRSVQVGHLFEEVGMALPAEVNGQLGDRWRGQFRTGTYPLGVRRALAEALRSGREIDRALGEAAKAIGGDAALITWMDGVEASPLTLTEWPGLVVETTAGPVVVDAQDEPYVVRAQIGMALVAADGEVILRYHDTYETVLSGARGPSEAARDLAHLVAREVAHVWAVDPRLYEVDPGVAEVEAESVHRFGPSLSFR